MVWREGKGGDGKGKEGKGGKRGEWEHAPIGIFESRRLWLSCSECRQILNRNKQLRHRGFLEIHSVERSIIAIAALCV